MSEDYPIMIEAVIKRFGHRFALRGADLKIPSGSVVGLLGRNGEGKTTLIKASLGLIRPDNGEAKLFGRDSWTLDGQDKSRIGYVPQVVSLYPWMRVGQMTEYVAAFYKKWNYRLVEQLLT